LELVKFNGIILKKMEMGESFEKIYSKAFKKMIKLEVFDEGFLEIFGDLGG
jgi:hypothetical protein